MNPVVAIEKCKKNKENPRNGEQKIFPEMGQGKRREKRRKENLRKWRIKWGFALFIPLN